MPPSPPTLRRGSMMSENNCKHPDLAKFAFLIHDCPNMKLKENDTDMDREYYECKVFGLCDWLDYEEMK